MKRKVLAILLALVMAVGMMSVTASAAYKDTSGHWAEEAIARWSSYGIVEGFGNGQFNPTGDLTRAQLAAIIARLLNLPEGKDAGFIDVDGHWAEDVINRCAAAGIMQGDGVNARPNDPVSREETMVMLGRALGIEPAKNADLSKYDDDHTVSGWAEGYVAAMTEAGIVNGIGGSLAPAEDIDRASAMTILHRAITAYTNEPGTTVEATGSGIVIVAAEDVTVTGTADSIIVAQGAAGGTTNLDNVTASSVTVQAEDASIVVGENTTVGSVDVTESAAGASVEVTKDATVGTVTTNAAGTTVEGSGKVEKIEAGVSATETTVNTSGSKVENNSSEKVTVGTGSVASGSTGTSNGAASIPSTGTSSGGSSYYEPSAPSHSHSYTYTPNHDNTHNKTCCSTVVENCKYLEGGDTCYYCKAPRHVHDYEYVANDNGTHNGACACGKAFTNEICDLENSSACERCGYNPSAVAKIGSEYYVTLADAVAVGGEIVLRKDVVLTETLTIPAGKTVVLDLNGKTVSMTYAENATANHTMILNMGNLTIQDTAGEGKLSYTYTGASLGTSYSANTITSNPGSTLTVEGGTIENLSYDSAVIAYAIDGLTNANYGDVVVVIKGGVITSERQAVRIFANSITDTGSLKISGGEIVGRVIMQNASAKANKATLKITGGTFDTNSYKTEVLYVGGSNGAAMDIDVAISGGTFNGDIAWTAPAKGIAGGTFTVDPTAYVVPGYKAVQREDASVWTIAPLGEDEAVARAGGKCFALLADAIAVGGEIELLADISESLSAIENVTLSTKVEGGVTITNTFAEDEWIRFNNVTLKSGVTLITPNVLVNGAVDGGCTNIIEGVLNAGTATKTTTYYQYNDAKTIVRNGGQIIVSGDTVLRYNYNTDSGIFIYGDGDDTTVEYSSGLYSGGYIGAYSGTFYAEDAVVNTGDLRLDYKKGSSEEPDKYAVLSAEFKNSTVDVMYELRLYKDATMTLTGSSVTAGKVQVREAATPVVTVDSESSLKAATVEIVTGALVNAIRNPEDGTVTFAPMVAKIGTVTYASLVDAIAAAKSGDTITLLDDVDLSDVEWTPIGTAEHPFSGTFDGNSKTISNLTIASGNYQGFFGYVSDATIKNVVLVNAQVSGGKRVGALAGQICGDATVSNCSVDEDSTITGSDSNTGGLIGEIIKGTVQGTNLINNAAVTNTSGDGTSRAGGIVGQVTTNANVTLSDCINNGTVTTNNGYAGGIVSAYQSGKLTLTNCANNGDLTGVYEGNMLGWYTSVRSITISTESNAFDIDAIGCFDIDIASSVHLYGKNYFVNKDDVLAGVSAKKQNFKEIFAEEEIGTAPVNLWDRILSFYDYAESLNPAFVEESDTRFDLFEFGTGFGEGWEQYLAAYNAQCGDGNELHQSDFNSSSWREHIVYFVPQES